MIRSTKFPRNPADNYFKWTSYRTVHEFAKIWAGCRICIGILFFIADNAFPQLFLNAVGIICVVSALLLLLGHSTMDSSFYLPEFVRLLIETFGFFAVAVSKISFGIVLCFVDKSTLYSSLDPKYWDNAEDFRTQLVLTNVFIGLCLLIPAALCGYLWCLVTRAMHYVILINWDKQNNKDVESGHY